MTFTSNIFLVGLLPWFLILLYLFRGNEKARKLLIFAANTVFYIWGGVGAFLFVCIISMVTWLFCTLCDRYKNKSAFYCGALVLLIPLMTTKYIGFVIDSVNAFFQTNLETPDLLVPIGISFFTFEAISCLSDVYRGQVTGRVTPLDIFLYLTFFPTVVSGPIVRISNFREGYKSSITVTSYNSGVERIAIGLCKKVLVADKIAVLASFYFDGVAKGNEFSVLGLWIGSVAYTLQLYYDFSGYSDMAIGIGELLGFKIPENFKNPYQAGSIQEFWRRWHISLSTWFRDYVYIPLGGNRCSAAKHIRNMLVVWLLTGIWHGAEWSFIVWGLGYFCLLIMEKNVPCLQNIGKHWYGHIYALFFVNLLWIPFRASNLGVAFRYISGMVGVNSNNLWLEDKAVGYVPLMLLAVVLCFPWNSLKAKFADVRWLKYVRGAVIVCLFGMAICAVVNASYTPYIYGSF